MNTCNMYICDIIIYYVVLNVTELMLFRKNSQRLLKNNSNKYWSEIKKIKNPIQIASKTIEGKSSYRDIADAFAFEYRDLYCCVQSDLVELSTMSTKD